MIGWEGGGGRDSETPEWNHCLRCSLGTHAGLSLSLLSHLLRSDTPCLCHMKVQIHRTEIFFLCLAADSYPWTSPSLQGASFILKWQAPPAHLSYCSSYSILNFCLLAFLPPLCVFWGRINKRLGLCLIHHTHRPGTKLGLEIYLLEE